MQHKWTAAWVVLGWAAAGCSTQIGGNNVDGSGSGGATGGGSGGTAGRAGGTGGRTGLGGAGGGSTNGGCALFTPDDPWNTDVSAKPVNTNWTTKVHALLGNVNIHPDFGSDFGIPINTVPSTQPNLPIIFDQFEDESDPGPYPFPPPATALIEGGDPVNCDTDCHMLVVKLGTCQLYEGYACRYTNGWVCGNGAHWDLTRKSLGQRQDGWTSADAAGLSIYAGLARYAEYAAGEITHAIRFTLPCTTNSRVSPATHTASPSYCTGNVNAPPMGLRMRLNASFDISSYKPTAQAFLRAFKRYGVILADNGGRTSTFFFQSETNASWNDDDINDLKRVPVSAFEAVDP
ncbi:MAG TPA: hypothetical protein VFH68_12620 [Polyangia bacterium]|jgi:hypothetical protein|nr:hypothetical protein [Polyangia bacterium]